MGVTKQRKGYETTKLDYGFEVAKVNNFSGFIVCPGWGDFLVEKLVDKI